MELTTEQLGRMTPGQVEAAFHPWPDRQAEIEALEAEARALGLEGPAWHGAEVRCLWDCRTPGLRGRLAAHDVCCCGGRARVYYVRRGFLDGHFEVEGKRFSAWGGPSGAETYAAALAAVRGLRPSMLARLGRWFGGLFRAGEGEA